MSDFALWVEKYRPKELDDVVLDDYTKKTMQNFIDHQSIPHCLFVGKPGTGKTTIARILKDHVVKSWEDDMFLNASNDRGINQMRSTVLEFMTVPPLVSPHKVIIMDESDSLTNDAWMVLRNPIENDAYNKNQQTRFIFTANYINKIPDFMQSRCTVFEFAFPPRDYSIKYARHILEQEGIEYDEESLLSLVDSLYPDLRAIINMMQRSTFDKKLDYVYSLSYLQEMYDKTMMYMDAVVKKNTDNVNSLLLEIRTMLRTADIEPTDVCKKLLNEANLPAEIYIVINRYTNKFGQVLDKTHHFLAMLHESALMYNRMN